MQFLPQLQQQACDHFLRSLSAKKALHEEDEGYGRLLHMHGQSNHSTHRGTLGAHSYQLLHVHAHAEPNHEDPQDLVQSLGYQHHVLRGRYVKQTATEEMSPPFAIDLVTKIAKWALRAKSPEPPIPFIILVPHT